MSDLSRNLTPIGHSVSEAERNLANGHKGGVVWLTGLSASGKSTLAMALQRRLFDMGCQTLVLDGDNVRHGLCRDLGFSPEDRTENIRRIGEVAHLLTQASLIVITAFISPYRADRDVVRAMGPDRFHEIHVATSLVECERRDPKGLYARARAGAIADFTGITAPYEPPVRPELVLMTEGRTVAESIEVLLAYVCSAMAIDTALTVHPTKSTVRRTLG